MNILFYFLLILSSSSEVFSQPEEKLYRQCLQPTIRIYSAQDRSVSTAFIVRSQLVDCKYHNIAVTAAHCIGPNKYVVHIPLYDKQGKLLKYNVFPAATYACQNEEDLAIILFESPEKLPVVDLDFNKLKFGQKIFHLGYGLGDDARLDKGEITAFHDRIRTNAFTVSGDSGGPLFNRRNKVIGVCQSVRYHSGTLHNKISFFTPITSFKKWDTTINNAISFVYNQKAVIPVMAFTMLRLEQYEIGDKNANICSPPAPKPNP